MIQRQLTSLSVPTCCGLGIGAHPAQMSARQDFTEVWTDHDLGA